MACTSDISELVAGGNPNTGANLPTSPLCESQMVPLITFNFNSILPKLFCPGRFLAILPSENKYAYRHTLTYSLI